MQKNSKKNITGDEPPAEDVVIIHHTAIDYLQIPSTLNIHPRQISLGYPTLIYTKLS